MCDRHVDMQDIKYDYFKSLPNRCKSFIGDAYVYAESVDEIHKKAERALVTMHSRGIPRQDGDLSDVISVNALQNKAGPKTDGGTGAAKAQTKKFDTEPSQSKSQQRDVICWHCGDKGHYAGSECPSISQDQTKRGKTAYALAMKGYDNPRPYDKNFYIQRSKSGAKGNNAGSNTFRQTRGPRRSDNRRPFGKSCDTANRPANVDLEDEDDQ